MVARTASISCADESSLATASNDSNRVVSSATWFRRKVSWCSASAAVASGGGGIPGDLEHASRGIEGLAFRLVNGCGSHAEENGKLRQRTRRVTTEEPVAGDRRRRRHADRTVVVADLDHLGSRDCGLLGLDGGIDPQDLGGRPERPEQRDDLGPRVPTDHLDAGFRAHIRIVEDLCGGGEEGQSFGIGAPAVRDLGAHRRSAPLRLRAAPARPQPRRRRPSHGRQGRRASSLRVPADARSRLHL